MRLEEELLVKALEVSQIAGIKVLSPETLDDLGNFRALSTHDAGRVHGYGEAVNNKPEVGLSYFDRNIPSRRKMTLSEIAGLVCAAAAGGAINAVAGGGTLVTFPALLLFNTPAIVANATSTLALVLGTSGGIYGYRQHLQAVKPWLWRFTPVSLLGGLVGSVLLTFTSNKTFSRLVPFLILFATILFLAQGPFRRLAKLEEDHAQTGSQGAIWGAICFQFLVSVYGGYFGAGIGILMLASLGFIGLSHIHEMNTLKTILGSLINLVAALWFIHAGLIHWPKAGIMTVGALAGYFLGSHFSQQIPQKRVRQIITLIGFVLSIVTFYQQFLR